MTNIHMFLLMSVSGTIMYLLSIIFGKKIKHHVWNYAMLVTSVIMLLVPIQKIFEFPRLFKVSVPKTLNISNISAAQTTTQTSISAADIITAIWLIGAVFFAVRMIYKYIKTLMTLRQITEECYSGKILDTHFNVCHKMSIHRNIMLLSSKYLNSPLLFGIFRPTVVIPDKAFSESELEMILTHELTHYKHRDLWIALTASIAQCVHWFNPAVYFIGKSISEVCELFCDETVVKNLNIDNKKAYGNLILYVIEKELNSRLAYTTSMASAKNSIQKRLRKIVEFKMPTKASTIAGIMAVFACCVSSLTVFGFETAAEVIPEEVKRIVPIVVPTVTPFAKTTPKPVMKTPSEVSDSATLAKITYGNEYNTETAYELEQNAEYNENYTETPVTTDVFETKNEPVTSYIFNADFSDNQEPQSEVFNAEEGTKLSISKVTGSKDVFLSVHNAATGETIYDEREDKTRDTMSMTLPEGGEYYVTAHSENGDNAGIYIYGE